MKIMPRRRKRSGVIPLKVSGQLALGTLANNSLVSVTLPSTVTSDTYMVSADLTWSLRDAAANQKPIQFGLAHSDYTDAEIEECIEATGSWDQSDLVAQEQARRKVRHVGAFQVDAETDSTFNDGRPKRSKIRFVVQNGKTLKIWGYNDSGAALTTGSYIEYSGTIWAKR